MKIAFTILGEPASKANSRIHKPVMRGDKLGVMVIKSSKALAYESDALRQIPPRARVELTGPVAVTMRIFYASERPDLDESLILDVLQTRYTGTGDDRKVIQRGVYLNDRQVRERHVYHEIDRANPRAEITVEPREAQQDSLFAPPPVAEAQKRAKRAAPVTTPAAVASSVDPLDSATWDDGFSTITPPPSETP